eukprot:scaffold4843_cov266-Chaetoceros_neogracile.AAC.14
MVLNDLRSVWDNVPFYGKAVAAVAVMLQMGAGLIWLGLISASYAAFKYKDAAFSFGASTVNAKTTLK